MELNEILDLNDVLEDAQDFTYTLLRDYGYPDHELIDLWFEANHQWEITFKRVNFALALLADLDTLLASKLTEDELLKLQAKKETLLRGRRLFNAFYRTSDNFILRSFQYSTWLHQLFLEQNPALKANGIKTGSDPWWDEQTDLSNRASDRLREILVAEDPEAARAVVLEHMQTMHERVVQREAQLNPSCAVTTPDVVLSLSELEEIFVSLEIDHMFFD